MSPFGRCGESVQIAGVLFHCDLAEGHKADHGEFGRLDNGTEWRLQWSRG